MPVTDPISGEDRRKHLEFIQGAINRIAGNSFQIKTWSVAIITGLLAVVAAKESRPEFVLTGLFPAFVFWFLDASYFRIEHKYRKLFKAAVDGDVAPFCMETSTVEHHTYSAAWLGSTWSVAPLHGTIVAIVVAIAIYIRALSH